MKIYNIALKAILVLLPALACASSTQGLRGRDLGDDSAVAVDMKVAGADRDSGFGIKILSSNAHLFEGSFAGTFSPSSVYADAERKAELLRRAKEGQYDMMSFTEVWADDERGSFAASLSPTHKSYLPQPNVNWFSRIFSGSPGMVLSAALGEDGDGWAFGPFFNPYENMVNADQLAYKGVSFGSVRIKGNMVGWVQTHAQASYTGTEQTDAEARKRQMVQTLLPAIVRVKQFMKSQAVGGGHEGPTVLMGDLNIVAGPEEYDWFKAEVEKMGFVDCWTETHPEGDEPGYTYDPANNSLVNRWDGSQTSPQRLDYVFLSPGDSGAECAEMNVLTDWTATVGTETVPVSDHESIEVTVRIPGNKPSDSNNTPAKKSAGESCTSDDECTNDACGRPMAGTDNLVCCPLGRNTLYAFYDYCTGMPGGTLCWSDAMCDSGNCSGNWGGLRKGRCS